MIPPWCRSSREPGPAAALRVPVRYHPAYWALVFPIGMYGAATYRMATVTDLTILDRLPELALVAALIAWTAAFGGLLGTFARRRKRAVPGA